MQKNKDKKDTSQSVKKNYVSIDEYKKHVNSLSNKKINKITFFLDKQLQSEKTFKELLRLCNVFRKRFADCNDFATISRIKSHINFRVKHNNFFYKNSIVTIKNKEFDAIQLIAVNNNEFNSINSLKQQIAVKQ